MPCCKKKISNIIKGYTRFAFSKLIELPKEKYKQSDKRIRICQACDKSTWLTMIEYFNFIKENLKDIIKNIEDLTLLPELPDSEYEIGKKLFCKLCKCFIPAKAWLKEEKCPLQKW